MEKLDAVDAESPGSAVAEFVEGGPQLIIDLNALEFINCHALRALPRAGDGPERGR